MPPRRPKTKEEILASVIPLFSEAGFRGVTMRAMARRVGITAASLYHHFPDKQTLYLAAVKQAFANRTLALSESLAVPAPPELRLYTFLLRFCERLAENSAFNRIMQREILDGDEKRLRLVAEQVFSEMFNAIAGLSRELAPEYDSSLLAISLIGLVVYHYQITSIRAFLPGSRPEHNDPAVVARHVTSLLLKGIKTSQPEAFSPEPFSSNQAAPATGRRSVCGEKPERKP